MERRYDRILTIKISGSGPRFVVNASVEPTGSSAEGTFELLKEFADLPELVRTAQAMRLAVPEGDDPPPPRVDSKQLGVRLFDQLMQGKVRKLYDAALQGANVGLRIRLNISVEGAHASLLSALPWEILTASDDAGGAPIAMGSRTVLVRSLDVVHERPPVPFQLPLRILLVAANPRGSRPLELADEQRRLKESFGELRGVEFVTPLRPTSESIMDALAASPCQVVHFMGHGDFDPETGQGLLKLEHEDRSANLVKSDTLKNILQPPGTEMPQLVFLNACRTATTSRTGAVHPFGSVAASLVASGIPAVVGMQFPIVDGTAIKFARKFYERLAKGDPVDMATAFARNMLFVDGNGEWATPVLMLRPSHGILFDMGQGAAPPSEARTEYAATPAQGAVRVATPAPAVAISPDGDTSHAPLPLTTQRRADPPAQEREPGTTDDTTSSRFTVFLGDTSMSPRVRSQVAKALQQAGMHVLPAVPNPDNPEEMEPDGHDARVRELAAEAQLFVHLLGADKGDKVSDATVDATGAPNTYPVRQVVLGSQLLKPQLLLVDGALDIIEDETYRNFLRRLQDLPRDKPSEFEMRAEHLNVTRMVSEIERKRDALLEDARRQREAAARAVTKTQTAYVDVSSEDLRESRESMDLVEYLERRGVDVLMQPASRARKAKEDLASTADNVRKSSVVILYYGNSGSQYVSNRFDWFRRLKATDRLRTRIGVFVAPPPKEEPDLDPFNDVLMATSMHGFDPAAVDALLAEPRR